MIALPKISFTAGELAPWLYARIDLDAYMKGASQLENFIVRPFGGISRREGTEWIAWTKTNSSSTQIFPFKYSMDQQFILEFGEGYIRFIKNKKLLKTDGGTYEIASPWTDSTALETLRITQVNDVLYCVSPSVPPQMLARHGDLDWRLSPLIMKQGPWEDSVKNEGVIQYRMLSMTEPLTALHSEKEIFTPEMADKKEMIRLRMDRPEKVYDNISHGVLRTTNPPPSGNTTLLARGNMTGKLHLEALLPGDQFYQILDGWYYYFTCKKQFMGNEHYAFGPDARSYPEFFSPGVHGGINYETRVLSLATPLMSIDLSKRAVIRSGQVLKLPTSITTLEYQSCYHDLKCWLEADGGDIITPYVHASDLAIYYSHRLSRVDARQFPELPFDVRGAWEISTSGTWDAEWEIRRSYDEFSIYKKINDYEWAVLRSFSQGLAGERKNFNLSGLEPEPCQMGVFCIRSKSLSIESLGTPILKIQGTRVDLVTSIERYISPCEVEGKVINWSIFYDRVGVSSEWSFSSFGMKNGYPRCVALHQGRLWFGSTQAQPTTIWGSMSDDLLNFKLGVNDSDALSITMLTNNQNPICWIQAQRELILGTREAEWTLKGSNTATLSPQNLSLTKETNIGSHFSEALHADNSSFFIERGGRKIREFGFRMDIDSYQAPDISLLSEHLFLSGIKAWALQRTQSLQVWTVQYDGTIAVLTRNSEQNISAWSKMSLAQAKMHSITSIHGQESWQDELWCITQRNVNGEPRQSIERITASDIYLDSFTKRRPNEKGELTDLQHLAGTQVLAHPEGKAHLATAHKVSSSGIITLPTQEDLSTLWVIGLNYTSTVTTMPIEQIELFASEKLQTRVHLMLHDSSLNFSYGSPQSPELTRFDPKTLEVTAPYTGSIRITHTPGHHSDPRFTLNITGAENFKLLAITPEFAPRLDRRQIS